MAGARDALRVVAASACLLVPTLCLAQLGADGAASADVGTGVESSSSSITLPAGLGSLKMDLPMRAAPTLDRIQPDQVSTRRGAQEAQLYRRVAPSVVLVVTDNGIGSGTLLNTDGDILTNWHVVGDGAKIGVIFKPAQEGARITKSDVRPARVIRVDQVADLALIRVKAVPSGVIPVPLGLAKDVEVGSDVHAIGHPTGETWTYTKGVVSAIRPSYKWTTEDRVQHVAAVIQTQTPINPGNSGGPLLTDDGKLVGVNSFKATGEALNFAVSVEEARRFLASNESRIAARTAPARTAAPTSSECKPTTLYKRENTKSNYEVTGLDLDCDGKLDAELRLPFDKSQPLLLVFDTNGDSKPDIIVFSRNRDYRWDLSFLDTNYDGKWDLVGAHENGEVEPVSYEPYARWSARNR